MKAEYVGVLIAAPICFAVAGWKMALFSSLLALLLFAVVKYAVERGWIK